MLRCMVKQYPSLGKRGQRSPSLARLTAFVFGLICIWLFVPYDEGLVSLFGPNPVSSYSKELWMNCKADEVFDKSSFGQEAGLAVVVPLVPGQWERARDQMLSWSVYVPCNGSTPIDLYYYFDLPLTDPDVSFAVSKLHYTLSATSSNILDCFRSIKFVSANMKKEESKNSYWLNFMRTHYRTEGTAMQFYKLMLKEEKILVENYRYIFYMEPDTRPIQPNWLTALFYDTSLYTSRYWVRGSMIRYGKPLVVSFLPYRTQYLQHINGNAIYRFDDECFRSYLRLVREEYKGFAFDLAIHYHRYSPRHYLLHQYIAHRWEYTDLIADLSFWSVPENLPKSTKLIHGMALLKHNYNSVLQHSNNKLDRRNTENEKDNKPLDDEIEESDYEELGKKEERKKWKEDRREEDAKDK